jgi:transcriptional regulator with PAS, ATPase and Fis domain
MAQTPRKRSQVERWISQTAVPVFIIAADHSVAFFNSGCERLTGWSADEILGQTCQFATNAAASTVESVTGSICPPPEVWQGHELQSPIYLAPRHGAAVPRLVHFFPLRGGHDNVGSVLGIITPLKPLPPAAPVSPVLQLHAEQAAIRGQLRSRFGQETVVARSPAMEKVLNQADLAIRTAVHVCLVGEPGTGREHMARVIHYAGSVKAGWFVPVLCDQLSPAEVDQILSRLIEAHLAGAAPGVRPQPATVYLSEIEQLPRDLQGKLATALKSRPAAADGPGLRVISSSSRHPREAVAAGTLRTDLESLLTTLVIEIPTLQQRPEDLPILAQHFLEEHNRRHPKQLAGFAADVWPAFSRYGWPGNLDELQRVIQAAAAVAADSAV